MTFIEAEYIEQGKEVSYFRNLDFEILMFLRYLFQIYYVKLIFFN